MSSTFAQLGVPTPIVDALAERGIDTPFAIQAATIADSLAGLDVCGRAPTGSGKTLAFGIPLVVGAERSEPRRPGALVLAPTRELAEQIARELRSFAGVVRVGVVYGGVGYGRQLSALTRGIDILVACPGRLEDLLAQGELTLADVRTVVVDEADRMADMGFLPAVRRLLDQTRPDRQTILFSATLDGDVAALTAQYQRSPVRHEVGEETPDITAARHVFWQVTRDERRAATAEAVGAVWPAIVFARTRHGADRLAKQLGRDGVAAAAIHGGRSQAQRTRALEDFGRNKVQALVATDVAARGIHVDGVALVVHYDPPDDHKTYVHRSGRTARAGEGGVVLSLVGREQAGDARRLQKSVGIDEGIGPVDATALRELSSTPRPVPRGDRRPDPESDSAGSGGTRSERSRSRSGEPRSERPQGSGSGRSRSKRGGSTGSGRSGGSRGTSTRGSGSKSTRGSRPKTDGAGSKARRDESSSAGAGSKSGGSRSKTGGSGSKPGTGRSRTRADSGASGESRRRGDKKRHPAGVGTDGRPNRKARRAHLQPGARGKS